MLVTTYLTGLTSWRVAVTSLVVLAAVALYWADDISDHVSDVIPSASSQQEELGSHWRVPESKVRDAMEVASAKYGTDNLGIIFLLAKEILANDTDAERAETIKFLIDPPDASWSLLRQILDNVVEKPADTGFNALPKGWQTFSSFLTSYPAWRASDAYISHLRRGVGLVQRRQKVKTMCCINAPIMMHHYLVAEWQPNFGMIDLVKLVLQYLDAEELRSYLFDRSKCSSEAMMRKILVSGSTLFASEPELYEEHLQQLGPGLVSNFSVHADFDAANDVSFDGEPAGELIGQHAMVLLGARRDVNGKRWFLLQNSWTTSQFVEVSAEYMTRCTPTVFFVRGSPRSAVVSAQLL